MEDPRSCGGSTQNRQVTSLLPVDQSSTIDARRESLAALATVTGGVFTTTDASACGITWRDLAKWEGEWCTRVFRGGYLVTSLIPPKDPAWDRHLATANLLTRSANVLACCHTALAMRGVPMVGLGDTSVHLAAPTRAQRTSKRAVVHHLPNGTQSVTLPNGARVADVTTSLRMLCGHASLVSVVVALDHCLKNGLMTAEQFSVRCAALRHLPGDAIARCALRLADENCESPGESITRVVTFLLGLPVRSQVVIHDESGRYIKRVDLLLDGPPRGDPVRRQAFPQ